MKVNYFIKQSAKKNLFLIFIIPITIQLILINIIQSVSNIWLYYLTFIFFGILYLPYFYWLSIIVNFLHIHSRYYKLKINNFKVSLIINVIMVFNFVLFIAYIFSFVINGGEPSNVIFVCVGLIQFIGIISFSYTNYLLSKLIATIELNRNVYFNDIIGNLVAFSFPPLAMWIIQNKIKRMQSSENKPE